MGENYYVIAWSKGKRSTTQRMFGPFPSKQSAHEEQRKRKAPGIETRVVHATALQDGTKAYRVY